MSPRSEVVRQCARVVLVAILVGCSSGSSSGGPSQGGSISGKVVLAGVTDASGIAIALVGPSTATTTTAADGSFTLGSLAAGSYLVSATAPSTDEGTAWTAVSVDGSNAASAELHLSPYGTLTGKATFAGATSGDAGITVLVPATDRAVATDDTGAFTLERVHAGTHDVIASAPGWKSALDKAVVVAWKQTVSIPDLSLAKNVAGAGTITGKATFAGESKSSGIAITVSGAATSGGTITDDAGTWTLGGLADGTYAVVAAASSTVEGTFTSTVSIKGGGTVTASPFVFTPAGEITGKATIGAATGNAGILVFVDGTSAATFTDDAGAFALERVPTGTHTVTASKGGYRAGTSSAPALTFRGSVVAPPITLTVDPAATGALSSKALKVGLTAHDGVTVTLDGSSTTTATTTADGSYAFAGLAPGAHSLAFSGAGYSETIGAALVLAGGNGFVTTDTGVFPLAPIELQLAKRVVSDTINEVHVAGSNTYVLSGTWSVGDVEVVSSAGVVTKLGTGVSALIPFPSGNATLMQHGYTPSQLDYASATGTVKTISTAADYASPPITPDEKYVVYLEKDGTGVDELHVFTVADGSTRVLATKADLGPITVAPTSDGVTYFSTYSLYSGSTLEYVSIDGTKRATLSTNAQAKSLFSNDGKLVFFIDGETIKWSALATGSIASGLGSVDDFLVTPDAKYAFVHTTASYPGALQRQAIAGGAPAVLSSAVGSRFGGGASQVMDAELSPDGKTIVYYETATNRLVAVNVETLVQNELSAVADGGIYDIVFSADGSHVAFLTNISPAFDYTLEVADLVAGTKATIATGVQLPVGATAVAFTPDATKILYLVGTGSGATGTVHTLMVSPVDGSTSATLFPRTAALGSISPDGKTVALVNGDTSILSFVPVDGSAPTPVLGKCDQPIGFLSTGAFVATRNGTPAPFTFQNGVYIATAP
jgi:Tol biopolymer transport system component